MTVQQMFDNAYKAIVSEKFGTNNGTSSQALVSRKN